MVNGEVSFRDFEVFPAFARNEHFVRGAEELGGNATTMQRSVRALERKHGVDPVEWRGRRVRVRAAGRVLAREASSAPHTGRRDRHHARRVG
ncbi:LysR family transcriptional regulator [Amycolatopsis sp. NPDC049253]|uniref:LysR family transcriptional regulator n=1 Tax=Amycolatopsis sp. NPDC049253 TaxID=3155274 RepID=UPI00343CB5CB